MVGGGRGSGMADCLVVISGRGTSVMSGTQLHFSNILSTFWGSFTSASDGVGSCGGWWILVKSYTTCSSVSSQTPHFLQTLSIARPILCSKYLRGISNIDIFCFLNFPSITNCIMYFKMYADEMQQVIEIKFSSSSS